MDYLRTALPVVIELFGPAEGAHLAGLAARQIGMHYHDRTMALIGGSGLVPALALLLAGQGDEVTIESDRGDAGVVRQSGFRLMRGVERPAAEVFDVWAELWRGFVAAHDRRLRLDVERTEDGGAVFAVTPDRGKP
jgi:hypothetical protein